MSEGEFLGYKLTAGPATLKNIENIALLLIQFQNPGEATWAFIDDNKEVNARINEAQISMDLCIVLKLQFPEEYRSVACLENRSRMDSALIL